MNTVIYDHQVDATLMVILFLGVGIFWDLSILMTTQCHSEWTLKKLKK